LGLLTVSAGGSSITFDYDGGIRKLPAYDDQLPPTSVYDGAEIPAENEYQNHPADIRASFIKFAEFPAAEGTIATREGLIEISEHLATRLGLCQGCV